MVLMYILYQFHKQKKSIGSARTADISGWERCSDASENQLMARMPLQHVDTANLTHHHLFSPMKI